MRTENCQRKVGEHPSKGDETFIGGKARNMHRSERTRKIHGTGGADKVAVMGRQQA